MVFTDDIAIFGIDVKEICLMRSFGSIADTLSYTNWPETVLNGIYSCGSNTSRCCASGND